MKLVTAFVRPFKLEQVRDALTEIGASGLTVTEVQGYGRQKGQTEIYRGAEYTSQLVPKIKIEVVCADGLVDQAIEAILASAHTGAIGDGKIFVIDVEQAVRIRTGERGETAV